MKRRLQQITVALVVSFALSAPAAVHYVDLNAPSPAPPYTNWSNAARDIQSAVDVSVAGDTVLVTNGTYATGGRTVYGTLTNRVAINRAIAVQSVNGPRVTVIQGYMAPGGTDWNGTIRCAYLTNGAALSGFTLTNGATGWLGDANQVQSGGGVWCESTNALVSNCVISGNYASDGGGGAYSGTLNNCTLVGNTSYYAGGAYLSTLNNSTLVANWARVSGGGAYSSTLNNCALSGNTSAYGEGGGAYLSTLNNCTLTGNSAEYGGGAAGGTLTNCLVYFNTSMYMQSNYDGASFNYCCTAPLPSAGVGNISVDPLLASGSHLTAGSPCRGAGSTNYAGGTDIDGEPWAAPPSIGCDEYWPGAVTGPLSVSLTPAFTNILANWPASLVALVSGRTTASAWSFGDGVVVSNQPFAGHVWQQAGDYQVVLTAYNESNPGGISATATVQVVTPPFYYVAAGNAHPVAPYTNWATAAADIQSAVDVARPGGIVLVTNGTYKTGGRLAENSTLTNRVLVDRSITVRSVNGPEFTVIEGYQMPYQDPWWKNGAGAIRCVSLADGTALCGFTVTKGATLATGSGYPDEEGGGVRCLGPSSIVSNCVITGNAAYQYGAGVYWGIVTDCQVLSNTAPFGGGAYSSMLARCTLTGNLGTDGGGANGGTLDHCILTANTGAESGGGAYGAQLTDCALADNSSWSYGGGASYCTLTRCTLTANSTDRYGGGAFDSTLINCVLTRNSGYQGGGALNSGLTNCTLTGNSASSGGGAVNCTLNNSIVYFNSAALVDANYSGGSLDFCCTTPLPPAGAGNITLDPQLASDSHLSATSPCRGAGNDNSTSGTDIDGEPWMSPPAIGCDEVHAGSVTGPLSVSILPSYTDVPVGFRVDLAALISGRATASAWSFGDGVVVSNWPSASHAWSGLGNYPVVLTAYNESNPGGISATVTVRVVVGVHYVAADSTTPLPPYSNWATAAKDIQSAVDVAEPQSLILVNDGVYGTGGRAVYGTMTNRVVIDRAITVRSVNGPASTIIQGYQVPGRTIGDGAIRCAYLTNGAILSGFTLSGGATRMLGDTYKEQSGGGVWCEYGSALVSNCVLKANSAYYNGGGTYYGTLCNCTFTGNSANYGGGAYNATLNNCTLTANLGFYNGGGAYGGTLNNCIVYFNSSAHSGTNYSGGSLNYCCTTPQPAAGAGNIIADPQLAGASHLSAGSPCRGAGSALYASGTDIDGEPWASPPSIGCDEYTTGAVNGPLSVTIVPTITNTAAGLPVGFTALVWGRTTASAWNFGDGVVVSNQPSVTHAWNQLGDYPVVLTAYNESNPGGISATVTVRVAVWPVHYVAAGNPTPAPPYTNWATAALDIQSAVDAAEPGAVVLVSNGVYAAGGRAMYGAMTNRVAVDHAVTLQSVNGPGVTVIRGAYAPGTTNGDSAIRCVYLADGAVLSGFTLTNGATRASGDAEREESGGGIWCESPGVVVSNCVVRGNAAFNYGGGIYRGTLNNSTLLWNWAKTTYSKGGGGAGGGAYSVALNNCTAISNVSYYGGAAYSGSLSNCTLTGNMAWDYGGGAYSNTLVNCTLTGNSGYDGGGGAWLSTLSNCTLTNNSSPGGGGGAVGYSSLTNCMLTRNQAGYGGGAYSSTLIQCTLTGNSGTYGGGARASTLNNCLVISNTAPYGSGGGVYEGTLNNCLVAGNSAIYMGTGGGTGGGAYSATLNNCKLATNYASNYGGGAYGGVLNNCTLTGNSVSWGGGGAYSSALANCIVYLNTTGSGAANYTNSTLNYCCTTPLPTGGIGNITNAPGFVDYAGGNLRLQTNSPCINAGNNAYAPGVTDLDGRPRIVGGTVDIGAYEFQPGTSGLFLGWLQRFGLPTDGSADYGDSDRDGINNWLEFCAGTNPTNSLSALRLVSVTRTASGLSVTWQSVTSQTYFVDRSTSMSGHPTFLTVASKIPGQPVTTTYTDTNAAGSGPFFYRVGVQDAGWQASSSGSTISYAWLQQYGLPTDGSADYADPDHDGLNNWQEWRAGTDPTNAASALRMLSATGTVSGVMVGWLSVAGRSYSLERATNVASSPAFSLLGSNIAGLAGTTTFTDTNTAGAAPRFYRVRVEQ